MLKIAEELEQSINELDEVGDAESVLAAQALDFAAYDSDDLMRVASLMVGFADAFDREGLESAATKIDNVFYKLAKDFRFWNQPSSEKVKMLEPSRPSLGPLGHSLQTRHSPDLPGVSLVRESDGVYRDPVTNKIYDFTKGFVLDDGTRYEGGSVSAQTPISLETPIHRVRQQIEFK